MIEERLTFTTKIYFSKEFLIPWRQREILMGKPRVSYGFHKPIYQDNFLNALFAFICEYFVLFFFYIVFKKRDLPIDAFLIFGTFH